MSSNTSNLLRNSYVEANKCVDALTRKGAFLSQDFVAFNDPPADVSPLLSLDTLYVRNICNLPVV